MSRKLRRPSRKELAEIETARDAAAASIADLGDTELEGYAIAVLREKAGRDGIAAASAWCAHWSDRLLAAAGRARQEH